MSDVAAECRLLEWEGGGDVGLLVRVYIRTHFYLGLIILYIPAGLRLYSRFTVTGLYRPGLEVSI